MALIRFDFLVVRLMLLLCDEICRRTFPLLVEDVNEKYVLRSMLKKMSVTCLSACLKAKGMLQVAALAQPQPSTASKKKEDES